MRALGIILLFAAVAAGQTKPLPADVNSESYSRLPLIKRSQLNGDALNVYDTVVGKDQQGNERPTPPLGPAATSLFSPGVAVPMDQLNKYKGVQFDPKVVEIFLGMPDSIWEDLRREINSHARKYAYPSKFAESHSLSS